MLARDIQAFEYVPLGPFTAKNFGTTISPWIVLPAALEPYLAAPLSRSAPPLEYLREPTEKTVYDISLHVAVNGETLTANSAKNLLWSFPQMVTHHSITGCNLRTGDLLGSGTISGEGEREAGCFLEATSGGKNPIKFEGGDRSWLLDGDEVVITGSCGQGEKKVGFGKCAGVIVPAVKI